jgi:hypothetical protein
MPRVVPGLVEGRRVVLVGADERAQLRQSDVVEYEVVGRAVAAMPAPVALRNALALALRSCRGFLCAVRSESLPSARR